ncbi:MAG: chemotaxis protein CheW [Candidatus Sumerlaeaceae bacterium]
MTTTSPINDCWNRIGVWGDGSCPLLATHIHCRNCPVFMQSATQLLDRPVPAEYLRERTVQAAMPLAARESGGVNVLIFRLEEEWLALPARVCQEVSASLPVHTIPFRRGGFILGLVNVRGELIISISLERVLGVPPSGGAPVAAAPRVVIVQNNNNRFAFPVLEVSGIRSVAPSEIREVPATVACSDAHYVVGIFGEGTKDVGLLDEELLFFSLGKGLT